VRPQDLQHRLHVDGEAVFPVIGNQRIKVAVHLLPFMWAGPIPEPEAQ